MTNTEKSLTHAGHRNAYLGRKKNGHRQGNWELIHRSKFNWWGEEWMGKVIETLIEGRGNSDTGGNVGILYPLKYH